MKNVFVKAAALLTPISILGLGGVAQASSGLTQSSPCVQIALPVLTGGTNCVPNNGASGGAIVYYVRDILQLAGSVVGIVILLMIVLAGVQYITSQGSSGNVKSAKDRLTNAITALILFMFMVAILQFIVPGGVL